MTLVGRLDVSEIKHNMKTEGETSKEVIKKYGPHEEFLHTPEDLINFIWNREHKVSPNWFQENQEEPYVYRTFRNEYETNNLIPEYEDIDKLLKDIDEWDDIPNKELLKESTLVQDAYSFIPINSALTKKAMATCFKIFQKFINHDKKITAEEHIIYENFKKEISDEQISYLKLAQDMWYKDEVNTKPDFIHPEVLAYTSKLWQEKVNNLKNYPKFYFKTADIPLIDEYDRSSEFKFIHELMAIGEAPWIYCNSLRSNDFNFYSDLQYMTVTESKNITQSRATTCKYHPDVSKDVIAEKLATENNVQVVINSSALLCLFDYYKDEVSTSWSIPIKIKSLEGKKIVYIDKALAPKDLSAAKRNECFFKKRLLERIKMLHLRRHKRSNSTTSERLKAQSKGPKTPSKISNIIEGKICKDDLYLSSDDEASDNHTRKSVQSFDQLLTLVKSDLSKQTKDSSEDAQGQSAVNLSDTYAFGTEVYDVKHQQQKTEPAVNLDKFLLHPSVNDALGSKMKTRSSDSPAAKLKKLNISNSESSEDELFIHLDDEVSPLTPLESQKPSLTRSVEETKSDKDTLSPSTSSTLKSPSVSQEIPILNNSLESFEEEELTVESSHNVRESSNDQPLLKTVYNLWSLKSETSSVLLKSNMKDINILVRCKYHSCSNSEKGDVPNVVTTKLDYQTQFGAEVMSLKEISRDWFKTFIRPNSTLFRVRVDPLTGGVFMCERKDLMSLTQDFQKISSKNPHDRMTSVHAILHQLVQCSPGKYLLTHRAQGGGPFCTLYKEENSGNHNFNLMLDYGDVKCDNVAPSHHKYLPIDTKVITPMCKTLRKIPATFHPKTAPKCLSKLNEFCNNQEEAVNRLKPSVRLSRKKNKKKKNKMKKLSPKKVKEEVDD